ncbi:kinase-like protein [Wolfiporia cocos MD-104 SS10]|uniref:Kinase-like protein n=1 Tax=Wolfiporia cocos (strain MD-104) TaxID=742152 RepID=A0A2H3ITJ6_WOLCO|nr:kinase-like protein [Wolfiporia cocos MD-104 SS10]
MNVTTERITRRFIGAVEDEWQLYSDNAAGYTIGAPIGFGASSTVYAAQYQPPDASHLVPCALKVLDLDRLPPHSLRLLQRETQLMSLSKHPNVLRVRGTWTDGHKLYIAMRLMNAGSIVDVMRYAWPGGMEEEVVKCILKQALEGLNYLHTNGLMHRDVKPANLLLDDDGTVLLGDLGVAAFLWDHTSTHSTTHSHNHLLPHHPRSHNHSAPSHGPSARVSKPPALAKRKSFVGTPCYMAPEVINGRAYDASADIWSFGITALALTQGRAPRSLVSPQTALLQTVRDAAPQLERSAGAHAYSRALQEVVAACLKKDPAKRPTARELLATPLFRGAKKKSFLVGAVLQGLPPLAERIQRTRQPSVMTRGTMDSWDFDASAAASPNTSVYGSRRVSVFAPEAQPPAEEVGSSKIDEEDTSEADRTTRGSAEAYAARVRGHHIRLHSRSHSRNNILSASPTHEEHAHSAPIAEVELSAASVSSDTDSDVRSSSPIKALLDLPSAAELSTSPSTSTSFASESVRELPPLPRSPSRPPRAASSAGLWKRLTARTSKASDGTKERAKNAGASEEDKVQAAFQETAKDRERHGSFNEKSEIVKNPPCGAKTMRRRTMAMLGRSIGRDDGDVAYSK